jgi:hypothetical protein
MRNSRSPKSGKTFTRDRSTDRDSFRVAGKYSTGNRGGANDCSRATRSYGAAIGDGLLSRAPPAEAYHPGTALADHRDIEESGDARARLMPVGSLALMMGVPDLQMSIEGLL